MKKKTFSLLSLLLMLVLAVTPVSAGPGIKLSGLQFSLGSLIAQGTLTGLGNSDVTVVIDASGIPAITCTNYGDNDVPGQSYPKVSASGQQALPGNDPLRKNGRSPFLTETQDPETLPWDVAGCPNSNWTAHIDFIFWTDATISVYDTATPPALLLQRQFSCTTTLTTVTCTPK